MEPELKTQLKKISEEQRQLRADFRTHEDKDNDHFKKLSDQLQTNLGSLTTNTDMTQKMMENLEKHILRVEPVIQGFEENKVFNASMIKIGDRTLFWAKIIGAIGVIVVAAKFGVSSLLTYKP